MRSTFEICRRASLFTAGLITIVACLPRASLAQDSAIASAFESPAASSSAVAGAGTPRTLWSFLGCDSLRQTAKGICQLPACKTLNSTICGPLTAALGLNPNVPAVPPVVGPLPGAAACAGPPGPVQTAAAIAAQQQGTAQKVAAIRYLATVDCLCYPEVVHTLLASLDDCAEPVRYEALLALRKNCGSRCACCCDPRTSTTCPSCQCQVSVISRLSDLLLERDIHNEYRERSDRVRQLAKTMLCECLACRPVAEPDNPLVATRAKPDPTPEQDASKDGPESITR
jgi:hypothetical protein